MSNSSQWGSALLDYFRQKQAQFRQYRLGGSRFRSSRRELWEGLAVPSTQPVDIFANRNIEQIIRPYIPSRRDRLRLKDITSKYDLPNPDHLRAWQILQSMSRTFEYWPLTFTFDDVLGFGGMGLVLKYDELDKDKDVVRSVAVKRALTDESQKDLREEEEIMKNFIGAEHLVQIIPAPGPEPDAMAVDDDDDNKSPALAPNGGRKRGRDPDGDVDMDERPARRPRVENNAPILVMEYLQNGDIAHLIYRIRERDEFIPNRILWRLFLCMIRACIELANPPVDNREDKTRPRQLVHFDIDPRNVLIDEFTKEPGEHSFTPRLKIGDFGIADFMVAGARNDYRYYHSFRGVGKYNYFAPEQFTPEWDPISPNATDFPHQVAGNYGSHTNVWGIGLVMQSLITTCWPPEPPRATMESFLGIDYPTYGTDVLDPQYDDHDLTLRRTITLCLAHYPAQRPPLDQLLALAIDNGQSIPGDDWEDDELEAWTTLILYEPPERLPSPPRI